MKKLYFKQSRNFLFRKIKSLQGGYTVKPRSKRKLSSLNRKEKSLVFFLQSLILNKKEFSFESIFQKDRWNVFSCCGKVDLLDFDLSTLYCSEIALVVRVFYRQMGDTANGLSWYLNEAIKRSENEAFFNN